MNRLRMFWFLLITVVYSCKQNDVINTSVTKTQSFKTILDSIYVENEDALGLMVHVEAPDMDISWSGVAGHSDKNGTDLKKGQPVLIASNTKTYVSAAILRLVEQGKLDLNQSIDSLVFEHTNSKLVTEGYDTGSIKVVNLLNHTSGIHDYAVTDEYMQMVKLDPLHHYTRDEQIDLAMRIGEPLGNPEDVFSYADVNYLLLTEIIEGITKEPFYAALRALLDYNILGLNHTWFSTLEEIPENTPQMARQYWTSEGFDSYNIDHSFDLYGGGGIATTSRDLAVFCQKLFTGEIFETKSTLDFLYTPAKPKQKMEGDYFLGISSIDVHGIKGYGHGGFWGTSVNYFPELNASVAIFVLDRDKRAIRKSLNNSIIKTLIQYNNAKQ